MNQANLESYLQGTLQKLEKTSESIVKSRGYTREVERLRILTELIKEQLANENTRSAARQVR